MGSGSLLLRVSDLKALVVADLEFQREDASSLLKKGADPNGTKIARKVLSATGL